jgi:hypothetical protein
MKANTATNKGIFLGKGISPFPEMYAFAANANASNKSFVHSLDGVVEVDSVQLLKKMEAESEAKNRFFSTFPKFALD